MFYGSPSSGAYVRLLAPLVPLLYLDVVVDSLLKAMDEQFNSMKYNFSDSLIRVVLCLCLLRFFGMESYVAILFFSTIFNASLSLGRLIRVTCLRLSLLRQVVFPLAAAWASAAGAHSLLRCVGADAALPSLLLELALGGALYLSALWLLSPGRRKSLFLLLPRKRKA